MGAVVDVYVVTASFVVVADVVDEVDVVLDCIEQNKTKSNEHQHVLHNVMIYIFGCSYSYLIGFWVLNRFFVLFRGNFSTRDAKKKLYKVRLNIKLKNRKFMIFSSFPIFGSISNNFS